MTVEQLNVIVSANKADFDKKINEINKQLGAMSNNAVSASSGMLGSFKALASGLAALGIGTMISKAIDLAGDLEQNISGSESVFKNYAAVVQQSASTAASSLGLSESKYLATANKMGALFQGSGFSIAKSADMTTQAMQRASDVASIMGIEVESAMEAVAGMAKGNFTMMDNLGVAINDTNLQLYAQEKGLGKLETTQQKVNAAMQMFIDKTDYAAGNYERENDTYSGALTTLKAEFENFAAEAGTALLPLAQSVLPMLTEGLNAVSPVIVELTSNVSDFGVWLANLNGPSKTFLALMVGSAVVIPAVTAAQKLLNIAKLAYSGVLSILIPKQLTFASALKATMGWLSIIAGALFLFSSMSDSSKNAVGAADGAIGDTGETADKTAESVGNLGESMEELGNSAKSLAGFDEINKLGGSSSTIASSIASKEDVAVLSDANGEIAAIKEQLNGLDDLSYNIGLDFDISNALKKIKSGEVGRNLLRTLATLITGETDVEIIDGAFEQLFSDLFNNNWDSFVDSISSGARQSDLIKGFFSLITGVKDDKVLADAVYNFYHDLFSFDWAHLSVMWESGRQQIMRDFGDFCSSLGEMWTNYWMDVGRKGFAFFNGERSTTTPSSSGTTHGGGGRTRLTAYANGGFPDYGDIFIANERGPEMVGTIGGRTAVVNNSQIETAIENAIARGFAKAGNGQPVEIHVYTELDGEIIGESVTEYQSNRTRRDNGYKK